MQNVYPCCLKVAKRRCRLLVFLVFAFLAVHGQAQSAASEIELPDRPLTYIEALKIIATQLKDSLGYEPTLPELSARCPIHGRTTFGRFFAPLRRKGLIYLFSTDNVGYKWLYIKRGPSASPSPPRTLGIWTVDEDGNVLPGVSVYDIDSGTTTMTDSSGMVRLQYQQFPVNLYLTHIGRRSVPAMILQDSTTIMLQIDPQSLEEVTITPYDRTKRAICTGGYTTVQAYTSSYNGGYRRLSDVSTATVQSMLEGQATGLLSSQSSGVAGSCSYLTLRGPSSLANGTDPLYVVDGVTAGGGNKSASGIQSGLAGGSLTPWSFVAPGDIERIDVLRDADATAIYGSRGANGVLVISTRRWKASFPKWDFGISAGYGEVLRRMPFLNTTEYLGMRREAFINSGDTPTVQNAPDLKVLDPNRNFDWGKWLFGRKAPLANAHISCAGGDKMNNYTVGMNYLQESMPFPTQPDHDRLTGNINYNHVSANRRWTLRVAGLGGHDANHQFISLDPAFLQNLAPNAPPMLTNTGQLNFPPGLLFFNPLSVIRQPYTATSTNYLISVANSYTFNEHLSLKATAGINRIHTGEFGEAPLSSQDSTSGPVATGYFASTRFDSRVFEPELVYTRRKGKLSAIFTGGASFQFLGERASAKTAAFPNDVALQRRQQGLPEDSSSQASRDTYTSYFGGVSFNWNDQYILHLTDRGDGSSRFPPGHRFGNFGAIGFAWIFSDNKLFRHLFPYVSYGKIRFSEGVTGNNQLGDRTLQNIAGTSVPSFQSIPGLYPSNPTGTGWEKTHKTELSLDLGFMKNRILFNATVYRHRSDNLLQNGAVFAGTTLTNPAAWPLTLENSGYELSLSATLVDNRSLGWDVSINWSAPRSKLVSFPALSSTPYAGRLVVGQSINVLRSYVYQGVDRQTGLYTFADLDHDEHITEADEKVVGKFDVTGFGGFSNILRFRQFQFQVLVDARIGTGVNYLAPFFATNPPGTIDAGLSSNIPRVFLNRWRQPGDRALYQKVLAGPDVKADSTRLRYLSSSALLANTSFWRIRKVSLTYSLSPVKAMAMHLTAVSFFIDAQNLFVFSRYKADPETQSLLTTPTMRTLEAGIRLSL